jgi:hypothetical protein
MMPQWSHDGARAFAQACASLDLRGASVSDVEAFAAQLPMLTFYVGGEPVGALVVSHGGIHIGILPQWRGRWMTKGALNALRDALARTDHALIAEKNEVAQRFAHRLGWVKQGIEGKYAIYRPALS